MSSIAISTQGSTIVLVDADHAVTTRASRPVATKGNGILGAALQFVVAGILLTGTTMLGRDPGVWIRVPAVCAGLFFAYRAVSAGIRVIVGRPVDTAFALSIAWVGTLVTAALLAPVLPLGEASNSGATLNEPVLQRPDLFSEHPLGTNALGLDMLSRVLWGARQSLTTALVAIVLSLIVGGMIGLVAGYSGGWVDRSAQMGANVGLAFPPLVLLLVLGAIVGHSAMGVALALAILSVAGLVRIARAETVRFATREHTYVALILGGTRWQVLRREVLPPVAMSLVSFAFLTVPLLIVAEAALGYLGLGVRPPSPTWGNMIAEAGNGGLEKSPHLVIVPGAALVITVFALNLVGQRIRAKWEAV
jgi:peptide/nickel transport system permease protein